MQVERFELAALQDDGSNDSVNEGGCHGNYRIMIGITFTGVFENVQTENGPDHYAEKYGWLGIFEDYVPMPLNTGVNLAYTAVGIMWLMHINADQQKILKGGDIFVLSTFNWLAVFYSFIQLTRLLTQRHEWAVMDQWYTLPFFAWTAVMAYTIQNGSSRQLEIWVIFLSLTSYCTSLVLKTGFELSLACHIIIAVYVAIVVYRKYFNIKYPKVKLYFMMSCLSCSGFVVLKLLDHELPKIHWIFSIISGHFLSKIADFMQIYYVNAFTFACIEVRHKMQTEK